MMTTASLYETDLYAWAIQHAQLLRERRIDELDFEHLAEEIESVGASERRELQNRLEVLLAHLLKLHFLTQLRGQNERGWKATIREQRKRIRQCLKENPSLQPKIVDILIDAYDYAIDTIIKQTNVDENLFPSSCPYELEQILNDDFYP